MFHHYVLESLAIGYLIWMLRGWREFRYCIKGFFKDLSYCVSTQIRHWRGKYTDYELKNWNDKSRADYPNGVKPSVPWFEVKFHIWGFWHQVLDPYHNMKRGVKNFIYYAPLIWKDSWYDDDFLLRWIAYKCRRDAVMYFAHGIHEDHKETAGDLMEIAELCRRINEDNYTESALGIHEKKWGEFKTSFEPLPPADPQDPKRGRLYRWHAGRSKVRTSEQEELERREYLDIIAAGEAAIQADIERLGELFKRIQYWWD